MLGYNQWIAPRWLRKLVVGTEFHRSWLAGNIGVFTDIEDNQRKSVCDRLWYTNRNKI